MKLIKLSTDFERSADAKPEYKTSFRAMQAHLVKKAKKGLPYDILSIMQELNVHRLMDFTGEQYIILSLVIEHLIDKHAWRQCAIPGYFCVVDRKHKGSLVDIIDAFIPPNAPFTKIGNARMIKLLTGEDLKPDTHGKALARLITRGRFISMERGKYKRTHIGF